MSIMVPGLPCKGQGGIFLFQGVVVGFRLLELRYMSLEAKVSLVSCSRQLFKAGSSCFSAYLKANEGQSSLTLQAWPVPD